ncbi:amino acid ABC transporter ATP-binding/permease protein [Thetidibacter halocola]|uniref:ATP-binding cassette domain-containing protein n=1 Tax=Thetidibacter halocola TaxID=2827239 RepID=A0A8J8B8M6_9RHOB|nr:ATP-binding cassette domain-containing protein [Thetidibacter halocola]MBS0124695.1 ATP-binding cassette domain-containing protein [Thetidibacter halocola]
MRPLVSIATLLLAGERRAFVTGLALTLTVLVMGAALLGLSGWFITAAAAAGLTGLGILFNVFVPSALVRLLALGRTAARYGERISTHDATLRALSRLRVRLLEGLLRAPYRQLERLRANAFLNRVTADVEALDGVLLRLILPGLAGLAVVGLTALALALLVHPAVGLVVALGQGVLPTLLFLIGQGRARPVSRRAEAAMQALRSRLIDLIAARSDLAMFGQLPAAIFHVNDAAIRHGMARAGLDQIERRTGFALDLTGTAVTALALAIGGSLAQAGAITPAQAAIGIFASLALGEATAPIRRALPEIGRMVQAASRITPAVTAVTAPATGRAPTASLLLRLEGVTVVRDGAERPLFDPLSLDVAPGETVALTGPSGSGKSTLLLVARGLLTPATGRVTLGGMLLADVSPDWLRDHVAMVPQRQALIAGSVAENLRLAAPGADETTLWQALRAVQLADTITARGGLSLRLGFRGTGLSGGEGRRLALARALLCKPDLLLLDEPTEGLDGPTATQVLHGLRAALPGAAILMAAHRPEEIALADRSLSLRPVAGPDKNNSHP